MTSPQTVLEHLAGTGWFRAHGEVALTTGLAFCANTDPGAAGSLMELVRMSAGLPDDFPTPETWHSEEPNEHGRVDVTGYVSIGGSSAPVVVMEAKVLARLGERQVSSYVESQRQRLQAAGAPHGVLVVTVPAARRTTGVQLVRADLRRTGTDVTGHPPWDLDGATRVSVVVMSWDEVLAAMRTGSTTASKDLDQLVGACRGLGALEPPALTAEDLAGGWTDRRDDLLVLVDQVTRQASSDLRLPLLPRRLTDDGGLMGGFRHIGSKGTPNLAVGMRTDSAPPPLWVRWHRGTTNSDEVPDRLAAEGYAVHRHEGHLWVPLKIEPDVNVSHQIERIVDQVVKLHRAATASVVSP